MLTVLGRSGVFSVIKCSVKEFKTNIVQRKLQYLKISYIINVSKYLTRFAVLHLFLCNLKQIYLISLIRLNGLTKSLLETGI